MSRPSTLALFAALTLCGIASTVVASAADALPAKFRRLIKNGEFSQIKEAFVLAVSPPPVNGLGTLGGFKLYVQDRADLGYDALYKNTQRLVGQAWQTPTLANVFSTFTVGVHSGMTMVAGMPSRRA